MSRFPQGFSLRARIILLGLVLIVPLALLVIGMSRREAEHDFARAQDRAQLMAERANGDYGDVGLMGRKTRTGSGPAAELASGAAPLYSRLRRSDARKSSWRTC
jgi:hypothetical protein